MLIELIYTFIFDVTICQIYKKVNSTVAFIGGQEGPWPPKIFVVPSFTPHFSKKFFDYF